jgi:hypothetical protein
MKRMVERRHRRFNQAEVDRLWQRGIRNLVLEVA